MENLKENLSWKGELKFTLRDLQGNIVEEKVYKNLICNTFKNLMAGITYGTVTYTGIVNYMAVGTGANAPSASDTTLQTELARKTVNTKSVSLNVLTAEFYFAPTEANGSLKEAGAFVDGTASANTGQLVDRVAIDVTKTSANSLTVTLTLTCS